MNVRRPTRVRVAMVLGVTSAALLAVTLASPDWVERALDAAPDGGDGSAEWGLAVGLTIATLVCVAQLVHAWWRSAHAAVASRSTRHRHRPRRAAHDASPARC